MSIAGRPAHRSASNLRIAFGVLEPARRRAIRDVYAFCRRADDAVDEAGSPELAREALDAAALSLDRVYGGHDVEPAFRSLVISIREFHLPRRLFEDLIEGVRWDLEGRRYGDREALRAYCYRVASTVGLLCIRIFGCEDPRCERYAEELGVALQWTNILRDIGKDLQKGRLYLPATSMRAHGLTESDLSLGSAETRAHLRALIRDEAAYAHDRFEAAEAVLPTAERRRVLAARIMAAVYRALLRRVERAGDQVLDREIRLSRLRRARIAMGVVVTSKLLDRSAP